MSAATFRIPGHDTRTAVGSLTESGFVFDQPWILTTTLVDTFDGRLHRAGLRLELRTSAGIELVLSGDDVVPAHLSVDSVPRVVTDLAPGPFRSRIAHSSISGRCCRGFGCGWSVRAVCCSTGPARRWRSPN